jgi:hypothetical protein
MLHRVTSITQTGKEVLFPYFVTIHLMFYLRDNKVCILIALWAERPWNYGSIPWRVNFFSLFSKASKPSLCPTYSPIQYASEVLTPEVKRLKPEANHLHSPSVWGLRICGGTINYNQTIAFTLHQNRCHYSNLLKWQRSLLYESSLRWQTKLKCD